MLFSVATLIAVVGSIGTWHYESEQDEMLEAAQERGWNVFEIMDPSDLQPGDVVRVEAPWEMYRLADEYQTAEERVLAFSAAAGLGGIGAVLILLWNLILHAGHWIWMGRETDH